MPNLARVGDIAGGPIVNGAATVWANGIPVAQLGSIVAPHGKPPHAGSVIASASFTVFANGIPVARLGDVASCGHPIASAAFNVIAG
jgi:uncharacterized Zn-binding protein involved in type VI secretion